MRVMFSKYINKEKLLEIKATFQVSVRLLKLIWQVDKTLIASSFIAVLLPGVIPFLNIYIYKLIIDQVVAISSGQAVFEPATFYPLIGYRILTYFGQEAAFQVKEYTSRVLWTKAPIYLNEIFLTKLTGLDIQYFENDKFRDLLEKAREGYNSRPQQLVDNIFYGLQSLLQLAIAFVALARLNWFFVILILVVAIPEFISQTVQSKLSWGIWSDHSPYRKRYRYLMHVLEGPREFKEVKLFRLASTLIQEVKKIQIDFYHDNKKLLNKTILLNGVFNLFSTLVFVGIELYVIFQALIRKITVGDIAFYSGVVMNFQNGLGGLFMSINRIFDHSLYLKSVFDILDSQPIIKDVDNPVKVNFKKAPTIEFRNVTFAYPDTTKKILNNFNLVIEPGEKAAFVGENGAGKSTIIKLLARFYDVDEGEILINGINLKNLSISSWYDQIGVLFQDFNKYEHTVKENISFGNIREPENLEKIISASTSAGSHKFIKDFNKQYEQILGKMFEGGIEPSGGQWQKIALARAFFRNAPILVLDEPTAAIDAKAESEIFSRVERLSKDKTVLIISHRFSTVRNADKIYVVENGKIVESGTHQELMKENGQYASLFKLQAKGYQ